MRMRIVTTRVVLSPTNTVDLDIHYVRKKWKKSTYGRRSWAVKISLLFIVEEKWSLQEHIPFQL